MLYRSTRVLSFLLAAGCAAGSAQDAPSLASATPPQPGQTVIKVSVKLVQVDATVTDEKGHAVRDLSAKDFEILQDGRPQIITNFSYVSPPASSSSGTRTEGPSGNPNKVRFEDIHRTVALVVDDLGLSFESTVRVRQALKHYVDTELQAGDLVAILRTGSGVGALQQFTTDRRLLYAAIDRVRYNLQGGAPLGAFAPMESHATNFPEGPKLAAAQGGSGQVDPEQERRQVFIAGSLGAVRYVVEGLRGLPGRKELVLFSENTQLSYDGGRSLRVEEAMQKLVDAANRSAVVIYAIDPGGLRYHGLTAAEDTARSDPQELTRIEGQRSDQEFKAREGMVLLTRATGGLFLHDSNDLDGELRQAMEDAAGYYLIGYRPDGETFDPKTGRPRFHSLRVRVLRSGLQVRSRSGFFGVEDSVKPTVAGTPRDQMLEALTSPFSSGDIHVRLTALFKMDEKAGPVLDSMLYVDTHELHFTRQRDGSHKASFQAVAVTFDEDGMAVDSSERTFEVVAKDDAQYEELLKSGLVYVLQHPAKKPGPYQMRVAVRDEDSGAIGSASEFIEVPDLHHGRLAVSSIMLASGEGLSGVGSETTEASGKARVSAPAVRTFRPGEALVFLYQILNAHPDGTQQPAVETQVRLFRNGEPIFTGKPVAPSTESSSTAARMICAGAIRLGREMTAGDYVLQIAVVDKLAKAKRSLATQAIDFEVQ